MARGVRHHVKSQEYTVLMCHVLMRAPDRSRWDSTSSKNDINHILLRSDEIPDDIDHASSQLCPGAGHSTVYRQGQWATLVTNPRAEGPLALLPYRERAPACALLSSAPCSLQGPTRAAARSRPRRISFPQTLLHSAPASLIRPTTARERETRTQIGDVHVHTPPKDTSHRVASKPASPPSDHLCRI